MPRETEAWGTRAWFSNTWDYWHTDEGNFRFSVPLPTISVADFLLPDEFLCDASSPAAPEAKTLFYFLIHAVAV